LVITGNVSERKIEVMDEYKDYSCFYDPNAEIIREENEDENSPHFGCELTYSADLAPYLLAGEMREEENCEVLWKMRYSRQNLCSVKRTRKSRIVYQEDNFIYVIHLRRLPDDWDETPPHG
jgi:hypothetical protein